MFKLAIEICYKADFRLIHAMFLSLGLTKSAYFLRHPVAALGNKLILPTLYFSTQKNADLKNLNFS